MAFKLPDLPYAKDALEPHMSAQTFDFHYGKHHAAYVDKLNAAIEGTDLADKSLEEIIQATEGDPSKSGVFNNAAQVWNHTFFWNSMTPKGGGKPSGEIADRIESSFEGGYDGFRKAFSDAAAGQFGSGWAWLVAKGGKLEVRKTPNAHTPLTEAGVTPILTLDVWEHAYYLDFQNKRPDFIAAYLDHLVNWDFAAENLKKV